MKRFTNLDYLRHLVALEVVAVHCLGWVAILPPVATFVCISGYVIPGAFERSPSWKEFAVRRVARVYPALIASLLLTAVLLGMKGLQSSLVTYFTFGFLVVGAGNWALWSLPVEEVLYTVHVLVRRWWGPSVPVIGLILSCIFYRQFYAWHLDPGFTRLPPVLAAFCAGNLLFFCKDKPPLWTGLVFLCPAAFGPAIFWVCVSAFVVALCVRLPQLPKIPDISYGVYVYHMPIMFWLTAQGVRETLPLTLGFAVLVSALSYRLVEHPSSEAVRTVLTKPFASPSILVRRLQRSRA